MAPGSGIAETIREVKEGGPQGYLCIQNQEPFLKFDKIYTIKSVLSYGLVNCKFFGQTLTREVVSETEGWFQK